MAKKLNAKQRQKKLQQARKDGKVTAKEARNLRNLGVSENKITNTNKGKIKVTGRAKQNAKPKPAPAPTSNSTRAPQTPAKANPTPTPSRSNGAGGSTPNYENAGNQKDTGNKFLSGKQANQLTKLLKDPTRFEPTTSSTTDSDGNVTETTTPGDINFEALSENRLVQKGLRGLSASGKNVNDFSSNNDLQKLLGYAKPLASQKSKNNLSQFGARASGKISDIRENLGIDRATALELRDQFAKKGIETTDPKYQKLLNKIEKGLNSGKGEFAVPQLNRTFTGVGTKDLDFVNSNQYAKQLKKQNNQLNKDYQDINESFENIDIASILESMGIAGPQKRPDVIGDLAAETKTYETAATAEDTAFQDVIDSLSLQNETLGTIADGFEATNKYLTSELSTANAAVEEANRRTNNLRTAFTPGANPNAMSVLAGDYRKSRRRREDNALSDLSILTDLGSNKNQLSGLQLA